MGTNKSNLRYATFLAFVAAIGGFLYGYDTAVISGTIDQVTRQFNLDVLQQGWYVGCALAGSILGVACAVIISDRAGRKKTMILSAVLFSVSAIGCAFAPDFSQLVAYRIIGGVGIGVVSIISPLYISEIAIADYRGRLVSSYQLAITVGFLGAYLANYGLLQFAPFASESPIAPIAQIFGTENWRGMLGAEALPALTFLSVIFLIPESPRWLTLKKRENAAFGILRHIYFDREKAESEMDSIKASVAKRDGNEWQLLKRPAVLKAVAIGVAIAILGQFMGVNAVLYYGPTIFQQSGLSSGDSLFYQVLVGSVNMLTSVLALLIIDKIGRKRLVYYGVSGMIASLLMIAAYFTKGAAWGITPIALLVLFLFYIFCCAVSICAVIWVLLSEMYPTTVRGTAMSIAGFALWIGTYLIGQLTPWMLSALSPAGTFLMFAAMCVPYILIIRFLVPETTGVSLEKIEKIWIENEKRNSSKTL